MREPQEKTIGKYVYKVTPVMADIGDKLLIRTGKALLPAIAEAPSLTTMEGAAHVAVNLFANLVESDLEYMNLQFAEQTLFGDGENMVPLITKWKTHFAGAYLEQIKWLGFAIQVNFDFLEELRQYVDVASFMKKKAA